MKDRLLWLPLFTPHTGGTGFVAPETINWSLLHIWFTLSGPIILNWSKSSLEAKDITPGNGYDCLEPTYIDTRPDAI